MKPVPFSYHRAGSISEVCAILAEDPGAMVMAGGQTLMPLLAMRMARPTRIVDILRIGGLDGVEVTESAVAIGATTRQIAVERSRSVAAELPLLARVMPWVGHSPTRRRGTVGGSIANADPTAEIGLVAVALDAEILLADAAGSGDGIAARQFFLGPMVTALPSGAMVTGLRFPRRADRRGVGIGFAEVAQRRGDYALAAAAVELRLDEAGRCRELNLAVGGATDTPRRLDLAGLLGSRLGEDEVRAAVDAALSPLDMMEDHHASGASRRRAALALAVRVAAEARDAARRGDQCPT